jgi:hypothetical protein
MTYGFAQSRWASRVERSIASVGALFLVRLPKALPCAQSVLKSFLYSFGLFTRLVTPSADVAERFRGCGRARGSGILIKRFWDC